MGVRARSPATCKAVAQLGKPEPHDAELMAKYTAAYKRGLW